MSERQEPMPNEKPTPRAAAPRHVFDDWVADVVALERCLAELDHLPEAAAVARVVSQTRIKLETLAAKEASELAARLAMRRDAP